MIIENLQKKSHETLIKLLNNIGIIGAIFACIVDLVCVIIFVVGISINISTVSNILFAVINSIIGVLINILLRFQGQRYAEIENEELCKIYYDKKINENKKRLSMSNWQIIKAIQDIVLKGGIISFSIFGVIYISIEGSKNPIQILITIASLILFLCFGFINMSSSYNRFYNIQVPLMKKEIKEKGDNKNVTL